MPPTHYGIDVIRNIIDDETLIISGVIIKFWVEEEYRIKLKMALSTL